MNDVIYNILLWSDIKTVKNFTLTNRHLYQLRVDRYYWIEKFRHDDLILYRQPILFKEWVKEYQRSSRSRSLISKILDTNFYKKFDNQITILPDYDQTLLILNNLIKNQVFDQLVGLTETFIEVNFNKNAIGITLFYHFNKDEFTLYYNREEVIKILNYLFYSFPFINIRNSMGHLIKWSI